MARHPDFLRYASPSERRCISREDVGFYHAVIVGAVYDFASDIDFRQPATFFQPLQSCIEEHPFLSILVRDMHTDKPFYQRAPNMDLMNHVVYAEHLAASDDLKQIEEMLASNVDKPFNHETPPWKIVVLPLVRKCLIAFCYSHTIGDGISGVVFHRSFLRALNNIKDSQAPASQAIETPMHELPPPFDTPQNLPISWSFLLAPLLGALLPAFVSKLFGLRAQASTTDANTWVGSVTFFDPRTSRSRLKVREIEAERLQEALRIVRQHDAKLTGTLQEIIARAMNKVIPDLAVTNFVSAAAVNMRSSVGISRDQGGNIFSGQYFVHRRQDASAAFSESNWVAARSASQELAKTAQRLQDQPIGLLRYLPSIRKWTLGRIGQRRDCSFGISNLGAFSNEGSTPRARIAKMVFGQPAPVISSPIEFNVISVEGGPLVYSLSWQEGALGIETHEEDKFIEGICQTIEEDFAALK